MLASIELILQCNIQNNTEFYRLQRRVIPARQATKRRIRAIASPSAFSRCLTGVRVPDGRGVSR